MLLFFVSFTQAAVIVDPLSFHKLTDAQDRHFSSREIVVLNLSSVVTISFSSVVYLTTWLENLHFN